MGILLSVVRSFRQGKRANEAFKLVPTLFNIAPTREQIEKLHPRVGRMADLTETGDLALYVATKCIEDFATTPESAAVALRARMAVEVGKMQGVFTSELFLADFHSATARLLAVEENEELPHPIPEQGWSAEGDGCVTLSDPPGAFEDLPDWLQMTPERVRELEERVKARNGARLLHLSTARGNRRNKRRDPD